MQGLEVLLATESGIPPVANCVGFVVTACYWKVCLLFSLLGPGSGEESDVTNSIILRVLFSMPCLCLSKAIRPQHSYHATQNLGIGGHLGENVGICSDRWLFGCSFAQSVVSKNS